MVSEELKIDFKIGIHSRPAALIVKKVRSLPDYRITFGHNGKTVRGDSFISLLQLGISEGSKMTVSVEGDKEKEVLSKLVSFIKNEVSREG